MSVWKDVKKELPKEEGDYLVAICDRILPTKYKVAKFTNNLSTVDANYFKHKPGFYFYDNEYGWEECNANYWTLLEKLEDELEKKYR